MNWIDEFCNDLKLENASPGTIKQYRSDLNRFFEFIGWKDPTQISHREIRSWLANFADKRPATLARKIATLRSFFKWLQKLGEIQVNPMEKVPTPKKNRSLPKYLTIEELNALRNACEGLRERVMLELLFATGMRIGEWFKVNRTDIDWENREIRVLGKGRKERIIYFTDKAGHLLRQYLSERTDTNEALFVNKNGERLGVRSAQKIIKELGRRAGIAKKVTPHVLRHTAASNMAQQGVDLLFIKDFLGHSDISTTQIYSHLSSDVRRQRYQQWERNQNEDSNTSE